MKALPSKITSSTLPKKDVEAIISDSEFPWLISFPRTGSHWLRMLMELYFESPSLVRIFYYHHAKEFTCYHRHDEQLDIVGVKNAIYLYRDPVDTVYSQMQYHNEDLKDEQRLMFWSALYGRHLTKWLFEETFTTNKKVLTYENLQSDLQSEFAKLCAFFESKVCLNRLARVAERVTKDELRKKATHDPKVVNLAMEYRYGRAQFRCHHSSLIYDFVYQQNLDLELLFT